MARGGKHSFSKLEIGVGYHGRLRGGGESRVPLSKGERNKRLDKYDSHLAKAVLAIVGVAMVALLIWLDYKGY